MLREYKHVRQITGEATRRWFSDQYFDLIIWIDEQERIIGFQLCYDISYTHRALTWREESGFTHHRVDNGENRPGKIKAAPILVADGIFDSETIAAKFRQESLMIEEAVSAFVYQKLLDYSISYVSSG